MRKLAIFTLAAMVAASPALAGPLKLRVHGGAPAPPSTPTIAVGPGCSGATSQPAAQGSPGDRGYDQPAVANWASVPFQTVTGSLRVEVLAYHIPSVAESAAGVKSNIERVDISANCGAWTSVYAQTAYDGLTSYNADLSAIGQADGLVELRAIAYPTTGVPFVLQGSSLSASSFSLYATLNAGGSLPSTVKYVSLSGNDTTGTGTSASPYATIIKARDAIATAQSGDAGGGIVCVQAGSGWRFTNDSVGTDRSTLNRWFTVQPTTQAPCDGVNGGAVDFTVAGSTEGLRVSKLRLRNVSVTGIPISTVGTPSGQQTSLWYDSITYVGPGVDVDNSQPLGPNWVGRFCTRSEISYSQNACFGATLNRDLNVHNIAADAFSDTRTVINSYAAYMVAYGAPPTHPDVWGSQSPQDNFILNGVTVGPSMNGGGFFTAGVAPIQNFAVVNSYWTIDPGAAGRVVSQLVGDAANGLWLNNQWDGNFQIRTDLGFNATDFLVIDNTCNAAIPTTTGITKITSPGC